MTARQKFERAVALARDLEECWAEWSAPFYEGAWEHLGDAERDAKKLVAGLLAAEELLEPVRARHGDAE